MPFGHLILRSLCVSLCLFYVSASVCLYLYLYLYLDWQRTVKVVAPCQSCLRIYVLVV